jgi:hypothetical protein
MRNERREEFRQSHFCFYHPVGVVGAEVAMSSLLIELDLDDDQPPAEVAKGGGADTIRRVQQQQQQQQQQRRQGGAQEEDEEESTEHQFWEVFGGPAAPAAQEDGERDEDSLGSYSVQFDGKAGIQLERDFYSSEWLVKGLSPGGAADESGAIKPGDTLTGINEVDVGDLGIDVVLACLAEAQNAGRGPYTLRLRKRGARPTASAGGTMQEARQLIFEHKAKYYRPPRPEDGIIYCSVTRHRGAKVTSFNMHREDTGEFLIACSMDADNHGAMLFHTVQDSHLRSLRDICTSPDNAAYLGVMIPNLLGTKFRILDCRTDHRGKSGVRGGERELAAVIYDVNVMGNTPNLMKVVLRRPRSGGDSVALRGEEYGERRGEGGHRDIIDVWEKQRQKTKTGSKDLRIVSPVRSLRTLIKTAFSESGSDIKGDAIDDGEDSFYEKVGVSADEDNLLVFETKKPVWNAKMNSYVLDFKGRTKVPSKKNFIITHEAGNKQMEEDFEGVPQVLRHGKLSKSRFSVDFHYPISPMVALAICVTSFHNKLAAC